MAVGFRKSLFGFNCGDVMEYIEKSQKSFYEKEKELSKQVDELSRDLNLSNENYKKLNDEKELISAKLKDFSDKYEEIERLSENIGKLYLVAQANAQAIIENSEKSAELAKAEAEKNLAAISDAHASLDELKKNIIKTSDDFVSEVDSLIASLIKTKETVSGNSEAEISHRKQFDEIYNSIVK